MPALVDGMPWSRSSASWARWASRCDLEFPDGGGYTAIRWKNGWQNGFLAQHTRMLATTNITYNFYWQTVTGPVPQPEETRTDLVEKIDASLRTLNPEDAKGQELTRMTG